MPTTMYLIRENRQFTAYTGVVGSARLTGVADIYPGVTGDEITNRLTVPDNALKDGDPVYFSALTGGAGLSVNTIYWVVNTVADMVQLSTSLGGSPINFTTDITSATLVSQVNEMYVWSGEYRNQFQTTIRLLSNQTNNIIPSSEINVPATLTSLATVTTGTTNTVTPTYDEFSDEVAGTPLRQDPLKRTFWRFNVGTDVAPVYLYADFVEGDIISNNPPNTVPTA